MPTGTVEEENNMNISKAIVALSIALASPVAAESWDLGTASEWHLRLSETSEGHDCSMDNMPEGRADLTITVDHEGKYYFMITNDDPAIVDAESVREDIEFNLRSPSVNKTWTFYDSLLFSKDQVVYMFVMIGEDPYQRDFLADLATGGTLTLPGNKTVIASWSLDGSADALEILETCRQRIMGER
jgi:hypothetical protein